MWVRRYIFPLVEGWASAFLVDRAVSNAYEIAALVAVLERKDLITQAEVLEEIARLKQARGPGVVARAEGLWDSETIAG